ncbi:hypothetical protein ABPG72_019982 [Tetrahymena utriculariae]
MEQNQNYEDPQPQQLQELKQKSKIKKEEEEYQKNKNIGYFEYFWDILKSPFEMYDIVKKAKVLDYIEERVKDGVDITVDKVTDNPIVNTVSGLFNFLKSIVEYWYIYGIGILGLFIFIKKI